MELRRQTRLALSILLYTLVETSSATASFPAIQPIVGFSTSCTLAYNTPVSLCDIDDFRGIGGTGSCSADCQASLIASQVFVQRLCSGQKADGNSVIGHLFSGDIVNFLCGDDNAAATTAATTQANTAATQATTQSTTQSTTSMGTDSTSSTSVSAATTASGSGTTLITSTSSQNTRPSSSTSSSIPTSIESETSSLSPASSSSRSSSTSSSASATRTSDSGGSVDSGSGGGSPFDGTFTAAASPQVLQFKMLTLSCIAALILAVS